MSYVTPIERKCASLCLDVYLHHGTLTEKAIFDQVIVNGNAQTGIVKDKDTAFIVHQGTNEGKDWFSNIDTGVLFTPSGVECREGFYLHARKTWRAVRDYIEANDIHNIVFTGHSLGGASSVIQAQLCFEKYAHLQNTITVVTFGAPRCFKSSAAFRVGQNFDGRITRFVSKGDLVPSVPTSLLWRHTTGLAYISGGEVYRERVSKIQAPLRSVGNMLRGVFTLAKQHGMSSYVRKLTKPMLMNAPIKESPTKGYEVFRA